MALIKLEFDSFLFYKKEKKKKDVRNPVLEHGLRRTDSRNYFWK